MGGVPKLVLVLQLDYNVADAAADAVADAAADAAAVSKLKGFFCVSETRFYDSLNKSMNVVV